MPKRDAEIPTLATYWGCPPATEEIAAGGGQPLACIATTYTFDARFFETDLLPRFLGLRYDESDRDREGLFVIEREHALGTARVCVLVDAAKVDAAQSTLRWDQMPVRVPSGLQHAKVTLLAWERWVRVMVSSANISRPGYRRNREIAGVLDFFDARSSAPRSIALEVLGFLAAVGDMTAAPSSAHGRLGRALAAVRHRLMRWREMPAGFRPRQSPKVWFVPGLPRRDAMRPRSVLDQVIELWGDRRADEISVMTPFVGDPRGDFARIIGRLLTIPRTRDAQGYLVVPEGPRDEGKPRRVVNLPRRFLKSWAEALGAEEKAVPTFIPPLRRRLDPGDRVLHAKALEVSSPRDTLLLCGSSNFSPHGMGVGGAANVEANLCYLDAYEGRGGLHTRLPVDWQADKVENPRWLDLPTPNPEDLPPDEPAVPAVFLWAMLDQRQGALTLQLDPVERLPGRWRASLPRGAGSPITLFDQRRVPQMPPQGELRAELGKGFNAAVVTCLVISWHEPGRGELAARLPVLAAGADTLLPPAATHILAADAIIEGLISGRDPAEWFEGRRRVPNGRHVVEQGDLLRLIDTSGYTLYRVRRLGQALGAIGERLRRTVRTEDAVRFRLFEDIAGPCRLATAVERDWRAKDVSATGFALAEIALTTGYAGAHSHADRRRGELDLRPLYWSAVLEIISRIASAEFESGTGAALRRYAVEVKAHCRSLLEHGLGGRHAR